MTFQRAVPVEKVLKVPLAYYGYSRGLGSTYVTSSAQATDRQEMGSWVMRWQMKHGAWGSGLDTLLVRLQEVLRDHGSNGSPWMAYNSSDGRPGQEPAVQQCGNEELFELSTIVRGRSPRSRCSTQDLALRDSSTRTTYSPAHAPHMYVSRRRHFHRRRSTTISRVNRLPNLQLLDGVPNTEKQARLPDE